jgi:hypothetical protein
MEPTFVSNIETDFINYLEFLSEEMDTTYMWNCNRNMIDKICVKNISYTGNKEKVILDVIDFFNDRGSNFLHRLLKISLKHYELKTIDDFKNFSKNELFAYMVEFSFLCEGPRLVLINNF